MPSSQRAYHAFRHAALEHLASAAPLIEPCVSTMSGDHVARLFWAYSTAGVAPAPLLTRLLERASLDSVPLAPRDAATVLRACGKLADEQRWQPADCGAIIQVCAGPSDAGPLRVDGCNDSLHWQC